MLKLTIKRYDKEYDVLKGIAFKAYKKGDFYTCVDAINTCARIAYLINSRLYDDELEQLILDLSGNMINKISDTASQFDDDYIFIDSFGMDNRGLTQQYIRALIYSRKRFTYVLNNDVKNDSAIVKELNNYPKCKVVCLAKETSVQEYYDIVHASKPEKIIAHLSPWDIKSMLVLCAMNSVKRYLVNLTDHAFWLGKICCDFFIGFRGYSSYISLNHREISYDRLMEQPFYPIMESAPYAGLPLAEPRTKTIFTGGAFYKMYGDDAKFFKIIKRICEENCSVRFVIAGSGDEKPLAKFITDNNLNSEVSIIGPRKDITEVYKNIDIYLNTYPLMGGLMTQLAAMHGVPTVGYSPDDNPCNRGESFLLDNFEGKITFSDIEEMHKHINKLLREPSTYEASKNKLQRAVINVDEFNVSLNHILDNDKGIGASLNLNYDHEKFTQFYLDCENDYLNQYERTKLSRLKFKILKYAPILFVTTVARYILKKL